MRTSRGSIWIALVASTGALLFSIPMATGGSPLGPLRLLVKDQAKDGVYWCVDVEEGDGVVVEFVHSYERFPVREEYSIEGPRRTRLVRIVSRSMLNGQGFWSGKLELGQGGWAEVGGWETVLERIEFVMGSPDLANHRLILKQGVFSLSSKIVPGTQVAVEVQEGECEKERALDEEIGARALR